MPSSDTPRRIKGNTVVLNAIPPVLPEAATADPYRMDASTAAKVPPPTESTAPAHVSFCSGRAGSPTPDRSTRAEAPSARSQSAAAGLLSVPLSLGLPGLSLPSLNLNLFH